MNSAAIAILDGISRGDQIGGPSALAGIVSESVDACGGLDVPDLTQRYLHWHQTDAFDTAGRANKGRKHVQPHARTTEFRRQYVLEY